jgi:hypothetical protein
VSVDLVLHFALGVLFGLLFGGLRRPRRRRPCPFPLCRRPLGPLWHTCPAAPGGGLCVHAAVATRRADGL